MQLTVTVEKVTGGYQVTVATPTVLPGSVVKYDGPSPPVVAHHVETAVASTLRQACKRQAELCASLIVAEFVEVANT